MMRIDISNKIKYTCFILVILAIQSCHTPALLQRKSMPTPDARPSESSYTTPVYDEMTNALSSTVGSPKTPTWQDEMGDRLGILMLDSLFLNTQVGIYVYDLYADSLIFQMNAMQRMRPASCEKLVTAITSLHYLGGDYQLSTKLCIMGDIGNDGTLNGNVYVVGGMDPMLSRSDVKQMARALQQKGIKRVNGKLYVDLSMKDNNPLGRGWCWDDSYGPLTPLSVDNKDTFTEEWLSALRESKIKIPNSAITQAEKKHISGVLSLSDNKSLQSNVCPDGAELVFEVNHSIDQLLKKMMKDSDNIYAESLFYQLAAHSGEKHAGRKQAVRFITQLVDSIGLNSSNYQFADGSGLSLYNYASPFLLASLLRYAYQQDVICEHLLPSLPVSGVDGTLKNRMKQTSPAHALVQAKTGTVDGISSLSGYLRASNGHLICFSIINQGIAKGADGRAFQDRVCETLCR